MHTCNIAYMSCALASVLRSGQGATDGRGVRLRPARPWQSERIYYQVSYILSENINAMYQNHLKFLIATKLSLKFMKTQLDEVRDSFVNYPQMQSFCV